jgi:parallel beta-helix repeat protein
MKKSITTIVLLLILCFGTVSISQFSIVKAEATIYIRDDGSVEGTDKIHWDGDVYMFTADIQGFEPIIVERDSIVIDGAGYSLHGDEVWKYGGFRLDGRTNVTIKNVHIVDSMESIYLNNSSNNIIANNTLTSKILTPYPSRAIRLENFSNYNKIYGNIIEHEKNSTLFTENVVDMRKSLYNEIVGNKITTNMPCIGLDYPPRIGISDYSTHSNHTIISGNTITFNFKSEDFDEPYSQRRVRDASFWGFYTGFNTTFTNNILVGCSLFIYRSSQNTIADNFVDGKPIIYLKGVADQVIENDEAGQILLENCQNITVKNCDFSNIAKGGIQLLRTNSSETSNYKGSIYLEHSFYNSMTGSNCVEIELYKSSNNTITGNTVTNIEGLDYSSGITLSSSNYNNITENNITQNHYSGITLGTSRYNSIAYNNLTYNAHGIGLGEYSSKNTVYGNNVAHNHNSAMFMQDASDNLLFGNNFFANNHQIGGYNSRNVWDNGTIGNYWSDYNGTDENNDGMGDSPYSFTINIRWPPTADPITNYDNFPLIEPVEIKSIIPEFPSWAPLLVLLLSVMTLAVIYKRRIQNQRGTKH